jgi:WD40 repeat protein
MKILSTFKAKLATALLALALCATDAAAMRPLNCCSLHPKAARSTARPMSIESKTSASVPLQTNLVRQREALYKLLYDELDPMPPELIAIILDYDIHTLEGVRIHKITTSERVTGMAVLPDDSFIISQDDGTFRIWDATTGLETKHFTVDELKGSFRALTPLSNTELAVIYNNHAVIKLNLNTGQRLPCQLDQESFDHRLTGMITLDNNQIATRSRASKIRMFDFKTSQEIRSLKDQPSATNCMCRGSKGLLFVGTGYPGNLMAWSMQTKQCTRKLPLAISDSINCLAVFPNDYVAAGTDSGAIILWDPSTNRHKTLHVNNGHTAIHSIAVLFDGILVVGDLNGFIHLVNPDDGNTCCSFKNHQSAILWVIPLKCGKLISGDDKSFMIWQYS